MNNRRFRTVFNVARGMLIAVAEIAVSVSGGSASAQIIADPNAPRSQQAVVLPAGNGVPIVNIQTPTRGGVSMNQFSQFNVGTNGAILNNARLNTPTQLAGWIQANPHLATGSASVIVNQVNSNNPTLLNGYIEVAGQRAQVIIANPSGIQVNGAGFINAQSATLTTGMPNFNGNAITGYTVNQGTVQINGAGLDASTTDYTAIMARAVQVNAGIWAKNLDVIAGANQISVASVASAPTAIGATAPVGAAPVFAIDVSSLGGMYAGKIMLMGTEAGVGAKNSGTIMGSSAAQFAGAGEVTISVDGILSNSGRIQSDAGLNMALGVASTGGLVNSGTIYSGATSSITTITTNGDISNTGTGTGIGAAIAAQGNLVLTANGANSNITSSTGALLAAGLSSAGALGTADSSTGNLQITATKSINAHGQNLAAQNLSLNAQTINLSGSTTYAGNSMAISVSAGALLLDNTNLGAGNSMSLSTPALLSTKNSNISAAQLNLNARDWDNTAGNVTHTGTGDLTVNLAGNLTNSQGRIQANAVHTNLTAANLNNTDGLISGQDIHLVTSTNPAAQTLTNTNGTIYARQGLTVSSGGLGNDQGVIQAVGSLSVSTNNGNLANNQGQIQSQQSITLNAGTGNIASAQGLVRAAKDLTITSNSLDNSNTQGTNQGLDAANITVSSASINNNLGAMHADMGAGLAAHLNISSSASLTNNQGLLSSSGQLNIVDTGTSLAVASTGGTMVSGAALVLRAASLDNTNGFIVGQTPH
jgi:filamentous hemagglutinin